MNADSGFGLSGYGPYLQQLRGLAAHDHGVGQMLDAALYVAGGDERLAHLDLLEEIAVCPQR